MIHVKLGGLLQNPFKRWSKASLALIFLKSLFFSGGQEELGWRGFAQPKLQNKFGVLIATFIFGVLWALWHLPLFFNRMNSFYQRNILSFILGSVALSCIFTIIYNKTESTLMAVLFHCFISFFGEILETNRPRSTKPTMFTLHNIQNGMIILAFLIIGIFAPQWIM